MTGLTTCTPGQHDGLVLRPARSRSASRSRSGSPTCRLSAWIAPVAAREQTPPLDYSECDPPFMARPCEDTRSVEYPGSKRTTFVKFVHFDTPPKAEASDTSIGLSDTSAEASPPKVMTAESMGLRPHERLAAVEPAPAHMVSRGAELRSSSSASSLPNVTPAESLEWVAAVEPAPARMVSSGAALRSSSSAPELSLSGRVLPEPSPVPELRVGCGAAHDDRVGSADRASSEEYLHPAVGIPSVALPDLCVEHTLHRRACGPSTLGGSQLAFEGKGGDGALSNAEATPSDAWVLTASPAVVPFNDACPSIEQVPADAGGGPSLKR